MTLALEGSPSYNRASFAALADWLFISGCEANANWDGGLVSLDTWLAGYARDSSGDKWLQASEE